MYKSRFLVQYLSKEMQNDFNDFPWGQGQGQMTVD